MKIKGQLEGAQFHNRTVDPSNKPNGLVWLNTQQGKAKVQIGLQTKNLATEDYLTAGNIANTPSGNLGATTVQSALDELQTQVDTLAPADSLSAHVNDVTDAHAASAISSVPSGNLSALNVQSALDELQTDVDTRATQTDFSAHVNDTTDAHAASAISNVPAGNLSAITVQAALNELQADIDTRAIATDVSSHINDTTDAHLAASIGVVPSGQLSSINVQSALQELQGDINTINTDLATKTTTAALSAHEADTTNVHGISDTTQLVTLSGAQTLTNKALTSPQLVTPTTEIVTFDGQAATPGGNPASGLYKFYFKDDGKPYYLNSAGTETLVGSGASSAGVNFISNGNAETDTTGWVTFADGATLTDGINGTPNSTWTRNTNNPLSGAASFIFGKTSGASRLNEGVAYDFAIDNANKAQVLQVSFDYEVVSGGAYADGDVRVVLYDRLNFRLIEPTPTQILNTKVPSRWQGTFQTSVDSTLYRLIFYVATSTSSSFDLRIDNITVGPQIKSYGSYISNWNTGWVPTGSWTSGVSYSGRWKQIGDEAEYQVTVTCTGQPTNAQLTINLPSGHAIDTAKLATTTNNPPLGFGTATDAGVANYAVRVNYSSTTVVSVTAELSNATYTTYSGLNQTVPFAFNTNDSIDITFRAPIVGWSSSQLLSSDSDTRVTAAKYKLTSGTTSSSISNVTNVIIDFNSQVGSTDGSVTTGSAWKYTAQTQGWYSVKAHITFASASFAAGTQLELSLYKNGSLYDSTVRYVEAAITTEETIAHIDLIYLKAGEYIDFRIYHSSGAARSLNTNRGSVTIQRLSGPSQIAASSDISAVYRTSSGQSIGNNAWTTVIFGTKVFDSFGSMDASTGVYTFSTAGKYAVFGMASFAANSTGIRAAKIVQAGSIAIEYNGPGVVGSAVEGSSNPSTIIQAISGDTVKLQVYQSSGGNLSLAPNAYQNFICITKVG